MARQIQRDIGVLADLGAGVGIGQQLDSQLLVGILRQHGAGGIHSNLQAVVGAANDLAIPYDLRDLGFHLGHAQGQGVGALDGVVIDGFIFQGLAGVLVQPAAIVVDGRCLGQVQHGIGLGLVGIHILPKLGAVVFHHAADNVDNKGIIVCIFADVVGADAAAVLLGNIIRNGAALDIQILTGGGIGLVIIGVVVLVANFRLTLASQINAAAVGCRVVRDLAVVQVQAALAIHRIVDSRKNAAATGGCCVAADDAFVHGHGSKTRGIPIVRGAATYADAATVACRVVGNFALI